MFVGRRSELSFLESHYKMPDSRILVIYGRKGVGKTTLLGGFSDGKNYAYYAARSASEREQRYQWARELNLQGKTLDKFPSYEELFRSATEDFLSSAFKTVLILDEFQHFVKADPDFMPALIRFVESCSTKTPILVVLCSSASGWVENNMISKMGRSALSIAGLLKIREMHFKDMIQLFPGYSMDNALKIYTALGGNPGLWNSFTQNLSAKENMVRYLLPPGSRLHEEMSVYMSEELRETAVYNSILASMASGISKLNDLYLHTGFSRAKISVYLKNLMELDLVEKVYSFETGGYANTQKGIYRICNPYVQFYYKFLFPNQSALQTYESSEFFYDYVADDYKLFIEDTYCKVCREMLSEEFDEIGEWIGKTGKIDIVAKKEDGKIVVAVCRYGTMMKIADYNNLISNLEQAKITPDEVRFYSEKGFDQSLLNMSTSERRFGLFLGAMLPS